jgi:hypothetical protein
MGMSPDGYDAEADFYATGKVLCDDCGTRLRPRTVASLPDHGCATVRAANRLLLSQIIQRLVFRNLAGSVQVTRPDGPQPSYELVDYAALNRLTTAGMVALTEQPGVREPWYEITDRALRGA